MENKENKILITGGTGFLGSYIIRTFLKAGYRNIFITKRKESRLDLIRDELDKITVIDTHINDLMGMEAAMEGVDTVIHAAALVSFVPEDESELFKTNVEGTETIVNVCLTAKIKKLIFVSSVAALGRLKDEKLINEQNKWVPSNLNTQYAKSKYLAEQHIWRGKEEGLDVAIINPSLVIGPGFWNSGSSNIFKTVYKGLPFYPPGNTGVVDVRDVAAMILSIFEKDISGERIISSGGNISYQSLFEKIAISLGVNPPKRKLSRILGSVAWRIIKIQSWILGNRPTITQESMRTSFNSFYYDNTKSVELLGYKYYEIDQTIEASCQSFLNSKKN